MEKEKSRQMEGNLDRAVFSNTRGETVEKRSSQSVNAEEMASKVKA